MKKLFKNTLKLLGGLVLLLLLVILSLGFFPVPEDAKFDPAEYGAGSSSVQPSYTGLQREFPALNGETTPELAELGRMLFFDPALSEDNDLSCAQCHHPDFGFADGQRIAVGAGGAGAGPERTGGVTLTRSTPSIWNVGFSQILFWDGRETSLERQALTPLTRPDEMGVTDTAAMSAEIASFPGYIALFEAAYGDGKVSEVRVLAALAAFERTLVSDDSPFDRYAAGDLSAITPAQRRGLNLFRSAALRCFECHQAPTFGSDTLRVVGVPSMLDDPGAAFRVPSLRNVALTAPYMHNGAFDTLEEVIQFYDDGGGNAFDVPNVDPFVLGFDLTEQEKADLVAFLFALTDESGLPALPDSVPSGLPVIPKLANPAREQVNLINQESTGEQEPARPPQTIRVEPGETIQSAVDRAQPGDTVEIPYGTYNEVVAIDISDFTLIGIPNAAGDYPILDGQGVLPEGVISSGNNFEVAYLKTINYTHTGVLVEGVTGVHMHHMIAENTGVYGLYPVQSTDVLIEDSVVSGVNDAGIYAGQSENVIIRNNEVFGNVLGIEAENTVNTEISGNHTHDNTMGILVVLLPNLTSKVNLDTRVFDNIVENNNIANFAMAGTAAAIAPAGSGIAIIGADGAEVYNNTIRGNKTAGIGVFDLTVGFDPERINVPSRPEDNYIHDNILENNGYEADAFVAKLGIPGADILWDVSGSGNQFDQPEASTFPPLLPTSGWAKFFYNIYWRLLNFLIGLL